MQDDFSSQTLQAVYFGNVDHLFSNSRSKKALFTQAKMFLKVCLSSDKTSTIGVD